VSSLTVATDADPSNVEPRYSPIVRVAAEAEKRRLHCSVAESMNSMNRASFSRPAATLSKLMWTPMKNRPYEAGSVYTKNDSGSTTRQS
jgi:hypothetical protein